MKTCRPMEGWACLLLKKKLYIFERPVSSGSFQDLNARKKYIYYNSIWLSLSYLVGLWQTKCGIIWKVLNICDRAIIYYKDKQINISFHTYLISWMLIRDRWFHAVFTRQSSDKKRKILEK